MGIDADPGADGHADADDGFAGAEVVGSLLERLLGRGEWQDGLLVKICYLHLP